MNKKDYKAIAEIIKRDYLLTKEQELLKSKITKDLADYFEKEDNKFNEGIKYRAFNKQQFLKDCGVDEE